MRSLSRRIFIAPGFFISKKILVNEDAMKKRVGCCGADAEGGDVVVVLSN